MSQATGERGPAAVPVGWQRLRLGDILQLRKDVLHPSEQPTGQATFVGLEHVESETGRRIGAADLDLSRLSGRKPRFYKGDIVYGYLRPYLNKVWVAEFDGLCSVDQYVYSPLPDLADPNYVGWFMRSPTFLGRAPIHQTPGQLPRIRTEEVASVPIELPPLVEQRRIANVLAEQLATVERARAAAEAQLKAAAALPAAYLGAVFHSDAAKRWPRVTLDKLSHAPDAFCDGPFGSKLKTEHYSSEGARVVRLQNIGSGSFLGRDQAFIPMEYFTELERHSVRADDVVVAALGDGARPAGRACEIPGDLGPAVVKADCFRVRLPADRVYPPYLVAFFNSPQALAWMAEAMRGTTRPRVNLRILKSVELPLPPLHTQMGAVAVIAEKGKLVAQMRESLAKQLDAIAQLPAVLLRRVFVGEL